MESLLGKGFFPQELPPPFNSLTYGDFAKKRGNKSLPFDVSKRKTSCAEKYNLARAGNFRRELSILNPIHFALLAELMVGNWADISQRTKSTLSLTLPTVDSGDRSISRRFPLDILPIKRSEARRHGTFLLKADIARFYPSVYTHSIPWVIHGKTFAKANRDNTHLGNKFDLLVRNCQDGQTNGIPVGPDTSLVISELILARIDSVLKKQGIRGFRYMDDYELTFNSEAEALKARSVLQEALLEFELDLNSSKTRIVSLPQSLEEGWVGILSQFELSPFSQALESDLVRFFDRAFDLARTNPQEGVLKYAVGRLSKVDFPEESLGLIEDLLMQVAQVEAGAISFVLASMLKNSPRSNAARGRRRSMLLRLLERHAPQRHSSEVAWALWAFIAMKLPVPKKAVKLGLAMQDSVCALLLLHARKCKLLEEPNDLSVLRKGMNEDALYGPHWLLAYEANVKGWFRFSNSKDFVLNDRNFGFLKKAGVEFYDPSKTLLPTAPSKSRGKIVDNYLSKIAPNYGFSTNVFTNLKLPS